MEQRPALLTLCLIALAIILIASAFAPTIAAFLFPHLQSPVARAEIASAVWLALSIFALNLPLVIVARVLAAHQKSAIANLWNIAGTLGHRARRSRGLARRVAVGHGDVLDAAPRGRP